MLKIAFIFSLVSLSFPGHSDTKKLIRPNGSELQFYFERPSQEPYPILFLVHGSTCTSTYPMFRSMAPALLNAGIAVVAVEKYGLSFSTSACPIEYLVNNTIQIRVSDHIQVAAYLRKSVTGWNHKFVWAGGSEGGQVAALAAPLLAETSAVAMLASGGGLTMADELPIAFERLLRRKGASDAQIHAMREETVRQYASIKDNPTPYKEWLSDGKISRNTYKYWDSILWIKAMPLLEGLEVPLLLVHGIEDTSCPIESSLELVKRFKLLGKTNLTYKFYSGLEHNWSDLQGNSHSQEVMSEVFNWILNNSEPLKARAIVDRNARMGQSPFAADGEE